MPTSAQQSILPEVQEAADRLAVRRALAGVAIYPFVVLTVGWAADLGRKQPGVFAAALAAASLIAALRIFLLRRFEALYKARPRLWRRAFYGSLVANAFPLAAIIFAATLSFGQGVETFFLLTLAAVIASLAIILYSHAHRAVLAFVVVLNLPCLVILWRVVGAHSLKTAWEILCVAVFFGYIALMGNQLKHERWAGLTSAHFLAVRAAELEAARDELRQARDGLERQIEERTRELRKASEDYRRIFDNAHDAILILRPEDEVVLNVNRRACEIYGFAREEFLGMSLAEISENAARGREHVLKTLEQGVFYNFETTQRRRDGSSMFLEINASQIEYEGRPAILSINRDVTLRRRAEELRLAKETAEQADRAKGRFLANMSHEIRTPMAGVLGLVDLLRKTELSAQQRNYADLIRTSANSLLRLIDDILDFSRIEAGKMPLEREVFDLPAALREIVELLRFQASAQGTELTLETAEGLPRWVWGDPGRLRQVLNNLVGNAVKFTTGGAVHASVRTLGQGWLRFAVRDTGIGIPHDAQSRLFGLFMQADSSTSRRYGGSGLGLAISQRIVQQMGGEISFESNPGEGSTFWFNLRFDSAPPPAPPPMSPMSPISPMSPTSREATAVDLAAPREDRRRRILVAEDNVINQLVITQQLAVLGLDTVAVSNGREALEALQRGPVDLILMDCQMPELDGYEATVHIRASTAAYRDIPIVALTAHAMREDLDRCLAVGMNDAITKPFQEEILRQKLERWLFAPPATGRD